MQHWLAFWSAFTPMGSSHSCVLVSGWVDIGYNFVIGRDSQLYVGRGWKSAGAHTKGYNDQALCIAFMGNFDQSKPSEAMLSTAQRVIKYGVKKVTTRTTPQVLMPCGLPQANLCDPGWTCPKHIVFPVSWKMPNYTNTSRLIQNSLDSEEFFFVFVFSN